MPKAGFYAVKKGFRPGVYSTWGECEDNTKGFPGALHKKFNTLREAEQYVGVMPIETSATQAAAAAAALLAEEFTLTPSPVSSRPTSSKPYEKPKPAKSKPKVKAPEPIPWDKTHWTVVYTDGASQGNGRPGARAGVGVWYGVNDPRNVSERCPGDQTNNRAELIAIIRCLELDGDPSIPLIIKTDSKYSMSCITEWLPGWIARGWRNSKGEPVKNKEVIQHLAKLLDDRPGQVKLEYIKGHAGEEGNEGADVLAVAGTSQPPLGEREWNTEMVPMASSSRTAVLEAVEVDVDFLLSDGEMDRMVAGL